MHGCGGAGTRGPRHLVAARAEAGDGCIDQLADIGALVQYLHRAGLEPAHVQQVLDQAVQPVGLVVDGLEQDVGLVGAELELLGEQAG